MVSFFRENGFEVLDIRKDVSTDKIIEEADKFNADIIGTSALLTTTMEQQKNLMQALKDRGLREKQNDYRRGAMDGLDIRFGKNYRGQQ